MPESELEFVLEILLARCGEEYDPEAPKAGDILDDWGNLSALRRASAGKGVHFSGMLGRLSQAEIASHGETIGEAWGQG
jgi:hypothetical protein